MYRRSSTRRWLIALAVLFGLYAVAGFLILPRIAKMELQKRLAAQLGRPVTIAAVRLNPITLSATIDGLAVYDPDGENRLLGWRRLHVNFDASASFRGEWVLSDIMAEGLAARIVVNADGTLNLSDLVALIKGAGQDSAAALPTTRPWRVGLLRVVGARLEFADLSRPQSFETTIGPVSFAVANLRTSSGQGAAPYSFEAVTESGERFAWGGALEARPFRSSGELSVENVQLAKYAPYYASRLHGEIASGVLSARARYEVDFSTDRGRMQVRDGSVQLRDLKIRDPGQADPFLEVPTAEAKGVEADARARVLSIAAMDLTGGQLRLRRDSSGTLNAGWLRGLVRGDAAPTGSVASPGDAAPELAVGEFSLHRFSVGYEDASAGRPVSISLAEVELALKNVTLADRAQFPVQLSFNWMPRGTVRLDGNVGFSPFQAALNANLADVDLLPLAPYAEQWVDARLTQGALTAALNVVLALPDAPGLDATLAGTASIDRLAWVDRQDGEPLAGFDSLALHGLFASTTPEPSLVLDEAIVRAPHLRVVVRPDHSTNLTSLLRPPPAASAPPAGVSLPGAPARRPEIRIGRVTVTDGSGRFVDRSVEPNVRLEAGQLGGTVSGLSSASGEKGRIDLKAAIEGASPLTIAGAIDPLSADPFVDVTLDARNLELVRLAPYIRGHVGHEVTGGQLAFQSRLLVSGRSLEAASTVTVEKLSLGEPIQSTDATKPPARISVALLTDREGRIVFELPVKGRLGDPGFRVAPQVGKAIEGLLTRSGGSPFSVLGAEFGGGGADLEFQEFKPGTDDLLPAEARKLETLARALRERPALTLEIAGSYDTETDTPALKRARLEAMVRQAAWARGHPDDPDGVVPDGFTVSPRESASVLQQFYEEKFPQEPRPAAAAPAPAGRPPPSPALDSAATEPADGEEPRGLFGRVFAAVTFQRTRQKIANAVKEELLPDREEEPVPSPSPPAPIERPEPVPAGPRPPQPPAREMAARLAEEVPVTPDDLRALAEARAHRVREHFVTTGQIAPERLFLAPPPDRDGSGAKGAKVFLHLR